jgi:hypothetical protein
MIENLKREIVFFMRKQDNILNLNNNKINKASFNIFNKEVLLISQYKEREDLKSITKKKNEIIIKLEKRENKTEDIIELLTVFINLQKEGHNLELNLLEEKNILLQKLEEVKRKQSQKSKYLEFFLIEKNKIINEVSKSLDEINNNVEEEKNKILSLQDDKEDLSQVKNLILEIDVKKIKEIKILKTSVKKMEEDQKIKIEIIENENFEKKDIILQLKQLKEKENIKIENQNMIDIFSKESINNKTDVSLFLPSYTEKDNKYEQNLQEIKSIQNDLILIVFQITVEEESEKKNRLKGLINLLIKDILENNKYSKQKIVESKNIIDNIKKEVKTYAKEKDFFLKESQKIKDQTKQKILEDVKLLK